MLNVPIRHDARGCGVKVQYVVSQSSRQRYDNLVCIHEE